MVQKRTSITDLARQLNLSPSTISRALNGRGSVSEATARQITALAQRLGYQANSLAVGLRSGRSQLLGVIVPHIDGNFFSQVVKGIEAAASKAGYQVIICQSNEDVANERRNVELLLKAQVDGILVSLSARTHELSHFAGVRERNVPLVFFDRVLDDYAVSSVVIDDRAGAYRATRHLLEQGYRRIAHFAGPQHLPIFRHRRLGYEDALRDYGLPTDPDLLVDCHMDMACGAAGMRRLLALPQPPDAIFSASDIALVGALGVLDEHGIRVPQAMGLVGFSNDFFAGLMQPRLTSIDQHCELMGRSATQLLLQIMAEHDAPFAPRRIVLQPELLVRSSSVRRPRLQPG